MLSYKLKHLCSQMFASLAAFGLFSLGNDGVRAEVKAPSASFNFNGEPANFTVTAAYDDACNIPSTFKGIESAFFSGGATGTDSSGYSSTSGTCVYTCKAGYKAYVDGEAVTSMTGLTGDSGTYVPSKDCYPYPTCSGKTWSESGVYVTKTMGTPTVKFEDSKGFYCQATCNRGFSSGGGSNTTTTVKTSYATSASQVLSVEACKGKDYQMLVDCGSGSYSGSTSSSGFMTVQYGKTVNLPDSGACSWAGHLLNGYDLPEGVTK